MPKQKVGTGETTMSIAKQNGFFWEDIWNHGENAQLKAKRKDPNILFAGDEISIPEKHPREVSKASEAEHTFKLKGTPAKLKIKMIKFGEPRSNEKYQLKLDSETFEGVTDGDGKIEHFIPPDITSGQLILKDGKEVYNLKVGNLDPLDLPSGVQQRLNNLGYNCGAEMGEIGEETKAALKEFQADNKLEASGAVDSATKAKLQELSK